MRRRLSIVVAALVVTVAFAAAAPFVLNRLGDGAPLARGQSPLSFRQDNFSPAPEDPRPWYVRLLASLRVTTSYLNPIDQTVDTTPRVWVTGRVTF